MIYPWIFNNWLKKVLKAAELEPYTLHSLEHTNITMQIATGVPLVTVSARAGHARTSTTTDIYAHFMRSSDQMAAETIDKMFANEDEIEEAKLEVKEDKKAIEELTSDDVNAYRKAKQEMTRFGFESYDKYLDYLDFKSKVGNRK